MYGCMQTRKIFMNELTEVVKNNVLIGNNSQKD